MADKPTIQQLIKANAHFGHLTHKWDPKIRPYIFMESNGVHLIDLNKTLECIEKAQFALKNIVRSGRKIMFVATKKQAKNIVRKQAVELDMPYVTERWLGGTLTNFATIRKSLKKLAHIENQLKDENLQNMAKRERLMLSREKKKLEKVLGGISDLKRLPAALFVVDVKKERIAVSEAHKLNIPVFAIVDTNSDPTHVDFPIVANDDAFKSISIIVEYIGQVMRETLVERKASETKKQVKKNEIKQKETQEN